MKELLKNYFVLLLANEALKFPDQEVMKFVGFMNFFQTIF